MFHKLKNLNHWILLSIPYGYLIFIFGHDIYYSLFKKRISLYVQYSIIGTIAFFSCLKGYTNNDLYTNIKNLLKK